jgi:hypothetical protein
MFVPLLVVQPVTPNAPMYLRSGAACFPDGRLTSEGDVDVAEGDRLADDAEPFVIPVVVVGCVGGLESIEAADWSFQDPSKYRLMAITCY